MKKREKKSFKDGYISFTSDELRGEGSNDNAEAYEWLEKAMSIPKKTQVKSKKGEVITIDDIYPRTADETEQMRICIEHAEQSATNPNDSTFNSHLNELKGIVGWSAKRHWTFQWILLVGVLVTLYCISLMSSDKEGLVADNQAQREVIKAWVAQDTTIVFEKMPVRAPKSVLPNYKSANNYKYNKLSSIRYYYDVAIKKEKEARFSADTATTEKRKSIYLERADGYAQRQKEGVEEYETLNKMEFKEISEMALKQNQRTIDYISGDVKGLLRWTIFFMILIPLYILSQRPYGYTITRIRLESKIVGGIQKFFLGMAGGMAVTALTMSFLPDTKVLWSDGSTTHETNSANYSIMAMKLIFFFLALIVFCGTTCILMSYLTFQGLRRNYNWNPILAKLRGAATVAADKASEVAKQKLEAKKQQESEESNQSEVNKE